MTTESGSTDSPRVNTANVLTFEQPLNERVRTLLRLEHLFKQAQFAISGNDEWHYRLAVQTLIELLEILARGDVKSDILKELGRISLVLQRPGADDRFGHDGLERHRSKCEALRKQLDQQAGSVASSLRQQDLLASIIQRYGIPGGLCGFDLPRFQHWLQRSGSQRQRHLLESWYGQLLPLYESTLLLLGVIRLVGRSECLTAVAGNWQCSLDHGNALQMLRVQLPADSPCYPEISASKHFVTMRFLEPDESGAGRARPAESDIDFTLHYCLLT